MAHGNNRLVYENWMVIQDIIGDAKLWPIKIRSLFWTPCIKHFDRIILAAFVYVNGLNPIIFIEWARLLNLGRDEAGYRHFHNLLNLYEIRNYRLYAFNVSNNRYEWLDGSVRHYTHRSMRQ